MSMSLTDGNGGWKNETARDERGSVERSAFVHGRRLLRYTNQAIVVYGQRFRPKWAGRGDRATRTPAMAFADQDGRSSFCRRRRTVKILGRTGSVNQQKTHERVAHVAVNPHAAKQVARYGRG